MNNDIENVEQAKNSFNSILDNKKYAGIIKDDKHLSVLLDLVDSSEHKKILDIGTGTGYWLKYPFSDEIFLLHQRFINREQTEERHIGLSHGVYNDFETYRKVAIYQTQFNLGDKRLEVDVSDWDQVDYEYIDFAIREFLN